MKKGFKKSGRPSEKFRKDLGEIEGFEGMEDEKEYRSND